MCNKSSVDRSADLLEVVEHEYRRRVRKGVENRLAGGAPWSNNDEVVSSVLLQLAKLLHRDNLQLLVTDFSAAVDNAIKQQAKEN